MNTTIQIEIDITLTELIRVFSSFEQEQINIIPFEGSWTAGQLAQHMIMSNTGFVEMINGPVKETKRKPTELVEKIKSDFLDFSTKMVSPEIIRPPKVNYDQEKLINTLKKIQENLNQSIETLDLAQTCISFELPVYGFLTRLEALHFVLYHTQRHIHHLKKIFGKLVSNNKALLR